ncbi:RNase A-like domain-containing protein [Paraburkholderia sp. 32]|uniref:RNase A-like domain-containing protein n=2 Tax=Paraburkholderia TaxID=1822464 RepID=UPI003D1A2A53
MSYQQDADGVRVVLSAPQMAAVLARQSITQTEMLSNRLWGGLQIVGGVLEMVGASALCVIPEPTMLTKAGCVVFGVHGSGTAAAGLRQVWTGQDTATLTQQGTTKLAEAMKASPDIANNIGLSLDMVVPFSFAGSIKAVRAARITMGEINLNMHEAKTLRGVGGHTLLKHVGKDEAWLRQRLKDEPRIKAATSFKDQKTAEKAISEVMMGETTRIRSWSQSTTSAPLRLTRHISGDVGYGVVRKTGQFAKGNKVLVVLKREIYNGMPYYVLTAFIDL